MEFVLEKQAGNDISVLEDGEFFSTPFCFYLPTPSKVTPSQNE